MASSPVTPERLRITRETMVSLAMEKGYRVMPAAITKITNTLFSKPNSWMSSGPGYPFEIDFSPGKTVRITFEEVKGGSKRVQINRCVDGETLEVDTRATKCARKLMFNPAVNKDLKIERYLKTILSLDEQRYFDLHDRAWIDDNLITLESKCHGTDLTTLDLTNDDNAIGTIIDIFRSYAIGLQILHKKGLIHADVKPANLLTTGKITDFGLVRKPDPGFRNIAGTRYFLPSTMFSSFENQKNMLGTQEESCDAFGLSVTLFMILQNKLFPHLLNTLQIEKAAKDDITQILLNSQDQMRTLNVDDTDGEQKLLTEFGRERLCYLGQVGGKNYYRIHPDYSSVHGDFLRIVELLPLPEDRGSLEEIIGACFSGLYGPQKERTTIKGYVNFFNSFYDDAPAEASTSDVENELPPAMEPVVIGRKRGRDELPTLFNKRIKYLTA